MEEGIDAIVADAGYWRESNVEAVDPEGSNLLIATTKDWKQRKALWGKGPPRGRIPKGLSLAERMERKPRTKRGWDLYSQRPWDRGTCV